MKTRAIPFFAALGCSLTACGDKENEETEDTNVDTDTEDTDTEDTDTDDTDTDDTGEEEDGLSDVVGLWTVDAMTETYYGETYSISFPDTYTYTTQEYGAMWIDERVFSAFLEVSEEGDLTFVTSYVESEVFSIDGTEIYSYSYGYSYAEEGGTISFDGGSYTLELEAESLNCTLTGDELSCENDIRTVDLSKGGEIPEDTSEVSTNWPATPEYTKDGCVDAEIQGTGNSLEWGGFNGVEDDAYTYCYDDYGGFHPDGDDLVFSFTAPNDGCFAFDSAGTDFTHAISLKNDCDDIWGLPCSLTGHIEHEMDAGEEVLVMIDGASAEEQVFNLSINELSLDTSMHDELPSDTSALDVSAWTEEVDSDCGLISPAKTYRWTAPGTGHLKFSLDNPTFEVIIKTQDAGCGGWASAACDVAGGGNYFAPATYAHQRHVQQGHEYLITIGSAYGDVGTLSMTLTIPD